MVGGVGMLLSLSLRESVWVESKIRLIEGREGVEEEKEEAVEDFSSFSIGGRTVEQGEEIEIAAKERKGEDAREVNEVEEEERGECEEEREEAPLGGRD